MDPVVLLHILYGKPFPTLLLSLFTLYPSLLYSLVCLRCVSATDGGQWCLHVPALPHLTAFFLLHLHHVWAQCAAVQLGLAAYPALTGMQETPPRDKAAVQPFWGQDMLLYWAHHQC